MVADPLDQMAMDAAPFRLRGVGAALFGAPTIENDPDRRVVRERTLGVLMELLSIARHDKQLFNNRRTHVLVVHRLRPGLGHGMRLGQCLERSRVQELRQDDPGVCAIFTSLGDFDLDVAKRWTDALLKMDYGSLPERQAAQGPKNAVAAIAAGDADALFRFPKAPIVRCVRRSAGLRDPIEEGDHPRVQ